MYQVMSRERQGAPWERYAAPTNDPFLAMRQVQRAKVTQAEVTVVQAATTSELDELVDRMAHHDCAEIWAAGGPVNSPASSPARRSLPDERRWELEQGPGGDHDEPYRFELPASAPIMRAWVRLLARHRDDEDDSDPAA